jgi:hypothetical protein
MYRAIVLSFVFVVAAAGCDQIDTNRTVQPYSSFGAAVYQEGCQRVAYTGQLDQKAAGQIATVDVAGTLGTSVCVNNQTPPMTSPVQLQAIVGQKPLIVATADAAAPKDFLSTLENFLEQLLPLTDDGTMPDAVASLGDLLGTLAANPDFGPSLSRLALRNGYRPTKTAAGLVHTIVNYPAIDAFMGKTLALIAPGGTAENQWKTLMAAASMELKAAQPVDNPGDPERTLKLTLDLMLSTHPDLATNTVRPLVARDFRGVALAPVLNGKVQPPFVDADNDGLADVDSMGRFVDGSGNPLALPDPFPALGAADTAPRDAQGRALMGANSTQTLYQYLDLDGTVFGGLAKESLQLMDPSKDTTLGMIWGMGNLLGPRKMQTKNYMDPNGGTLGSLSYNGFDTNQSAVLDLLHGFVQLLGDPNADSTFSTVQTLLNNYESPTARLVGAMLDASDRGKAHPEAQVPATSDLYDDLVPIINRVLAVDGLPEDLVTALQDPRAKDFAPMVARLMQAKDQIDFDHTNPGGNGSFPLLKQGHDLDSPTPPDRTMPDSDYNRSLMQRIAHMIHDANGIKFCNKDGATPGIGGITIETDAACKLFEIDDLALFYILNMQTDASKATNPSAKSGADFCGHLTTGNILLTGGCSTLIGSLVGITGFGQFPTPAALNRSLFLRANEKPSFLANTTSDVSCSDGDLFIDVHDKSIFAWETTMPNAPSGNASATFYTAIAPIVDAFAKHDECIAFDANMVCTKKQNAAKILVDMFALLHEHWASQQSTYFGHSYQSADPTKPRYSAGDDVVSYEPLMNEVLGQADLVPAVIGLAPTLSTMTIDGTPTGQKALPYLIASAKYIFTPNASNGIAYRNGATSTTMSDGTTPVAQVTPYYLMADAYAHKRTALAGGNAMQSGAWKTATSAMVDQFLTVAQPQPNQWQFQNRHFRAITLLATQFIRDRIASHVKTGDLQTWVHSTLTQDLTDTLGGPTFSALADFTAQVESDPDGRTQLYSLLQYLVNEASNDLVFQTALTTLVDQVQLFLDDRDLVPVAQALGAALDPQLGAADKQLTLMKRAHDLDTNKALLTLLQNLYRQDPTTGVYPASNLADVLSQLDRKNPLDSGDLSGDDYNSILTQVQHFLKDEQTGFAHFLAIVKNRAPQN